jgi:hypothetical protein
MHESSHNIISRNNIILNREGGIYGVGGFSTVIIENNIINNGFLVIDNRSLYAIEFYSSSNNKIYHNNFINNTGQAYSFTSINAWDNNYPFGGNYWSDHEFIDEFSGPNQDQPGSDGICDKPYIIDENNIDRYPLMKPYEYKPEFIPSDYIKESYKLANFTLIEDWVWENCIPLLLLNNEGLDADTELQNPEHRPTWYWRVLVDEFNKRFSIQLIAHWNEQVAWKCALIGHKWDYEPIFLYYSYYGSSFYSSLENGEYEYEYCFHSAEHWWVDWLVLLGVEGSDCDDEENHKLYFWEENGRKHPVFALGLTKELMILYRVQGWKVPILEGCPMVSRFLGHAYSRVRKIGITGPELLEEITGEQLVQELYDDYGYEGFWPDNKEFDEEFKSEYFKPLTDDVIEEWESREENPFKMTPRFRSGGKKSLDLIDPWNKVYEGVASVGAVFDPGCGWRGVEAYYEILPTPVEGEWSEELVYQTPECDEVTFVLDWEGELNLDLHLWVQENEEKVKLVGKNYETGEVEITKYTIDGVELEIEYSNAETKPEEITISAYEHIGMVRIRTKIPAITLVAQVYTREGGEDPDFFLFTTAREKYSIERNYLFEVEWEGKTYPVGVLSNSTVSNFAFDQPKKQISFNVTGLADTVGFCNVTIPKELLDGEFTVWIGGEEITFTLLQNETHSFLYFTFIQGDYVVTIEGTTVIPEFLSFIPLTVLMLLMIAVTIWKRKKKLNT